MQDYNISFNFKTNLYGYVAAYQYVIKEKDISTVLCSQGHTTLESIRSLKSKRACKRFSEVLSQKKRRKLEENCSASSAPVKPVHLTNVNGSHG